MQCNVMCNSGQCSVMLCVYQNVLESKIVLSQGVEFNYGIPLKYYVKWKRTIAWTYLSVNFITNSKKCRGCSLPPPPVS